MSGAELFLRSLPVPFTAAVMVAAAGSFRIADPSRRHWPEEPRFEMRPGDVWEPVHPARVDRLAGSAELPAVPAGAAVRATGLFLPLSRVGTAARWRLQVTTAEALLAGGHGVGAVALLEQVELDLDALAAAEGPLVLSLHMGGGRYEALCELPRFPLPGAIAADDLALRVEPGAITYA